MLESECITQQRKNPYREQIQHQRAQQATERDTHRHTTKQQAISFLRSRKVALTTYMNIQTSVVHWVRMLRRLLEGVGDRSASGVAGGSLLAVQGCSGAAPGSWCGLGMDVGRHGHGAAECRGVELQTEDMMLIMRRSCVNIPLRALLLHLSNACNGVAAAGVHSIAGCLRGEVRLNGVPGCGAPDCVHLQA